MATITREQVHQLVDRLPEHELAAAQRYLEYLRDTGDPLRRLLAAAPIDDEPEMPEEAAGVAESYEDIAAGRILSHAEARRRLLGHA